MANATAYKLTGGVFSRKPSHLEAARREFRVGNLYLNRGITGALVGRQPFGGFGLSGIGSKAGGADYLLHFVEPRCCARTPCVTASPRGWSEATSFSRRACPPCSRPNPTRRASPPASPHFSPPLLKKGGLLWHKLFC